MRKEMDKLGQKQNSGKRVKEEDDRNARNYKLVSCGRSTYLST